MTDTARFRSVVYTFVSSLFSDPSSERFRLLFDESFRRAVTESCEALGGVDEKKGESLSVLARSLFDRLSRTERSIENEYVATFGHTLSKPTSPYELEHLRNEDVFYRTQRLADLEGFYRAFGLALDRKERADHISVETEFLAHLLAKEVFARDNHLGDDAIEVCRKAHRDFWTDHFGGWTPVFLENVAALSAGDFYPKASRFTSRFLHMERDQHHEGYGSAEK
ncbi:MAG: molecular chaperone [Fidelibacterota bacterium]